MTKVLLWPFEDAPQPRCDVRPGSPKRERFNKHSSKCEPVVAANRWGWDLSMPYDIGVRWHGGDHQHSVTVLHGPAKAHFAHNTITIDTGYIWRTPPGIDLLVCPVPNPDHRDFISMTAIVETDWMNFPWFLSLILLRTGDIAIPAGTPLARVMPIERAPGTEIAVEAMPEDVRVENKEWVSLREDLFKKHHESIARALPKRPSADHHLYRQGSPRAALRVKGKVLGNAL